MIAHLPADPLTEQTPDPQALSHAQRETKRLIDMSRGILQICVGLCCLVAAGLLLQPFWPVDKAYHILLVPLTILVPALVFQQWIVRARKRAGIPKVTMRAQFITDRLGRVSVVLLLVLVAAMVAVMLAGLLPLWWEDDTSAHPNLLFHLAFALLLTVPMVIRGVQLGLWEDILLGAGFSIAMGLMLTMPASTRLGWLCLGLGLPQLIAGYFLHRRWQAWVRARLQSTEPDAIHTEVSA